MALHLSPILIVSLIVFCFFTASAVRLPTTALPQGTTTPLRAACSSIDECRGGRANIPCCKSINSAIEEGGCGCACRQLKIYGKPGLASDCRGSPNCPRCLTCNCVSVFDDLGFY